MKYFKKLIGDRIYLSPRNSEDAEKFVEWLNDFQVTDYTGKSAKIITLDAEKNYLETSKEDRANFVIVTLEKDEMIGSISIEKIDHIHQIGTLGIFIGEEKYRNNGYGTEAIRLILDYGFNYLNLNNIDLRLLECNERAMACYKKCGFKECGRRSKERFVNGKFYDVIYMEILREDFQKENKEYIRNKNVK